MKALWQFLIDIIKNACSHYIEIKLCGTGIITLAVLKFYGLTTLNICYKIAFWIIFLFTLFLAMSLLCNFMHKLITKFKAYKYFCSISKNFDLYFSEKMLIEVLCRRNMQIFNYQMITKGFFDEYINYINENFCPDEEVLVHISKAEKDIESTPCVLTLISNLENCKFIYKSKEMKNTYKINTFIWNNKRRILKKAQQNENKKVQNFRKLINKSKGKK